MTTEPREFATFAEFWPFYLGEHLNPTNRWLHAIGSLCGLGWLAGAIAFGQPWLILAGLVNGYAFAWIGHFVFEGNKPATFRYPLKSFLSDWKLLALTLTGRVGAEIERLGLRRDASTPELAARG